MSQHIHVINVIILSGLCILKTAYTQLFLLAVLHNFKHHNWNWTYQNHFFIKLIHTDTSQNIYMTPLYLNTWQEGKYISWILT
jgi:uncharacterized phage-like protein YoqJ